MRSEFLQFGFEKLVLLTSGGLLIQNQDIRNVITVGLYDINTVEREKRSRSPPFPSYPLEPVTAPA